MSVRISNGAGNVDTLPVSIAAAVNVAGAVAISNVPSVAQSGAWNIGAVTSITNTVNVAGAVAISGAVTVNGAVTSNQGTAAAVAAAWPIKVTDGTNIANLTNLAGLYALKVDVVKQVGGGYSQPDRTAFTDGTTPAEPLAGVYSDAISGPAVGQAAAVRITSFRALHTHLRSSAGVELATAGAPLRVDPTGTTTQPVSGTVTANQGGAPWQVQNAPSVGFWRNAISFTASQTDIALHTPAAGKTGFVEGLIVTVLTSGSLHVYDQTNAAANMLYQGTPPVGAAIVIAPARPIPLAAVNNILRYATGAGATGDVTCWGFDA